jgi:hypothetical protein
MYSLRIDIRGRIQGFSKACRAIGSDSKRTGRGKLFSTLKISIDRSREREREREREIYFQIAKLPFCGGEEGGLYTLPHFRKTLIIRETLCFFSQVPDV